eukprot:Gb_31092 [translate_table: standard]
MDILCTKSSIVGRENILSNEILVVQRIAEMYSSILLVLELIGWYLLATKNKCSAYGKVLEWVGKAKPINIEEECSLESIYDLAFSFQDPKKAAKDAFLDVSSFFYGCDWDEVVSIVGEEELEILEERALVKRDPSNKLLVHM